MGIPTIPEGVLNDPDEFAALIDRLCWQELRKIALDLDALIMAEDAELERLIVEGTGEPLVLGPAIKATKDA